MMDVNAVLTTKGGRINFLKGLIRLAKCDGDLPEEELAFYQRQRMLWGWAKKSKS